MDTYLKALELAIKKKELGITDTEIEAIQAKLEPKPMPDNIKAEDFVIPASPFDNLSDEEMLYYATPHFDELMAKRELLAKKPEGTENEQDRPYNDGQVRQRSEGTGG